MYCHETNLMLSEQVQVDFEVDYTVSKYYPQTWESPAEGGEVEIERINVIGLRGETWAKTGYELDELGLADWIEALIWDRTDGDWDFYQDLVDAAVDSEDIW